MRGIIFDLDDTLYPHEVFVQSGFAAVASHVADSWRRNSDHVLATLRHAHSDGHQGHEFEVLCAEHRLPLSVVPMLLKTFRQHRPALAPQPAVQNVLRQLRQDGWRIGILTNGEPAAQQRKLDALGLIPFVDCVTYAEEHAVRAKPHPEAFLTAVARLHVPVAHCVHVGPDAVGDISGAHAVGLRAIRVLSPPNGHRVVDDERRHRCRSEADATVDTVLDVASVASLLVEVT